MRIAGFTSPWGPLGRKGNNQNMFGTGSWQSLHFKGSEVGTGVSGGTLKSHGVALAWASLRVKGLMLAGVMVAHCGSRRAEGNREIMLATDT